VNRVAATVVSIALVAVTVSPALREPWDDGFPLDLRDVRCGAPD
jgi:hypothetical protein